MGTTVTHTLPQIPVTTNSHCVIIDSAGTFMAMESGHRTMTHRPPLGGLHNSLEQGAETRVVHITTVPMTLQFLRTLIKQLTRDGVQVHVVSSPGRALDDFGMSYGPVVHSVPMSRAISPFADVLALARMLVVLRSIRPHVVHAHTPKAGLLAMVAAFVLSVPVRIYHLRGLPLLSTKGIRRSLLTLAESLSCFLAHRVICVSESLRRYVVDEGICPAAKSVVLHRGSGQGVDWINEFNRTNVPELASAALRKGMNIPADAVVIGFVGRLVVDKGIVELALSWKAIRERYTNAVLLLVGPTEARDGVPFQIMNWLVEDPRVHFLGLRSDVGVLYSIMDIFVLPSKREGFPNVLLEAAAMELPIVTTEVMGCVDAIDNGVTGTLVPPGDVEALTRAVESYMNDPDLRKRHGRAARLRVESDFNPGVISNLIVDEYRILLDRS